MALKPYKEKCKKLQEKISKELTLPKRTNCRCSVDVGEQERIGDIHGKCIDSEWLNFPKSHLDDLDLIFWSKNLI